MGSVRRSRKWLPWLLSEVTKAVAPVHSWQEWKTIQRFLKTQHRARCSGAHLWSQLLGRLRQENLEFKVTLGYLVRPWLKLKTKKGWG